MVIYDKENDKFILEWTLDTILEKHPLSIWWLVTWKCNLKCVHCYWNEEELPPDLWLDEAKIICEKIIRSWVKRVSLSWWEPMIRNDIFNIIKNLSDAWIGVILSSNGLNIPNNIKGIQWVRHVEISLDWASKDIHDKIRPQRTSLISPFDIWINAIKALTEAWIKTRVLTTLNRFNVDDLFEMWKILSALNLNEWHIWRTTNAWRARFIYSDLMKDVSFDQLILRKLQDSFPDIQIQFNFPSKTSRYYALIMPNGYMTTQDYITWEKIQLWSLLDYEIDDFWNDHNYDIKGHYIKWLNLNPETIN